MLEEWQTGEFIDLPFTETKYSSSFDTHLESIRNLELKPGGSEFLLKLRRKLHRLARYVVNVICHAQSDTMFCRVHSKAPIGGIASSSVYTDDDFRAALLEDISDGEGDEDIVD